MKSANKGAIPAIIEKYPAASETKDAEGNFQGSLQALVYFILPDTDGAHICELKTDQKRNLVYTNIFETTGAELCHKKDENNMARYKRIPF